MKPKRILVVGAGLSGLTAAAYASRAGHEATVLERSDSPGGLVSTFVRDGFAFDTGPRALGDSGILSAMLADLPLDLPCVPGLVSTGIADRIVHYDSPGATEGYLESLRRLFPGSDADIAALGARIRASCRLARDLHRLPNPYFKNPLGDLPYLFTKFIPWLPSFLRVAFQTGLDRRPIERVLDLVTDRAPLKDMVSQHFFKGTPHHFALGYFENFTDYKYPLGGTGSLPVALRRFIEGRGGRLLFRREAVSVDPKARVVADSGGDAHPYDELLWAADLNSLYARLSDGGLPASRRRAIALERARFASCPAGESALTAFLAVDREPEAFARVSRGHFIYTPSPEGLGDLHRGRLTALKADFARVSKEGFLSWLRDFIARNSFEISIPALKDPSLAPEGATGLVVSVLFDGELCALAEGRGWKDALSETALEGIVAALDSSAYPGLRASLRFASVATPQTLARRFGASSGAITGWSLEGPVPVASSLPAVLSAVRTRIPRVYKAGQWSYSPSGVPIAILTGRIAAAAMGA